MQWEKQGGCPHVMDNDVGYDKNMCVQTEDKDVPQHNMVFQLVRNVIKFSFPHHYDSMTLSFYSSSIINGHIVLMVIKVIAYVV